MTTTACATGVPAGDLAALRNSEVLGTVIPHRYGGLGRDAVAANQAVAELAQRNPSLAIVLFQHLAVSARIVEWGTPSQRSSILPRLACGQWLAASAWSESGAGAAKRSLGTIAERHPGGWTLTGTKAFVTGAGIADLYLVLVQSENVEDEGTVYGSAGQTLFLVPADVAGLSVGVPFALDGMRESATGSVRLDGCRVGNSTALGGPGSAATIIAGVRESGATLGAVSLGIAEAAYICASDHLLRGGANQAVRYRLVDLAARVEAVRACIERAGRRDSADPGTTVLHSKLFASTEAEEICAQAQRMLGSAGYLETHPLNGLARDARAVALMGPTNELCRELVSSAWT